MPSLPDVVSRVIEIDEGEIEVVLSQGVKRFLGRTDEMTSMTLSFHQQGNASPTSAWSSAMRMFGAGAVVFIEDRFCQPASDSGKPHVGMR